MPFLDRHIICLFLFYIGLSTSLSAQEYQVKTQYLSFEEGLSHRIVQSVAQDSSGFIWLGTRHGLNRYDGYKVKQYYSGVRGLRSDNIQKLYIDKNGKVWCVHYKDLEVVEQVFYYTLGIDIFDPKTEQSLPFDSLSNGVKEEEINSLHIDPTGQIYFSTKTGQIYNQNELQKPILSIPDSLSLHNFTINENGIWVNSINRITHFSLEGDLLHSESSDFSVRGLQQRGKHSIWVLPIAYSKRSPLCQPWHIYVKEGYAPLAPHEFNLEKQAIEKISECRRVITIKEGIEAHVYQRILYLYDTKDKRLLERIPIDVPHLDYPPKVNQLFVDRNNLLWLATAYGLVKVVISEKKFDCFARGASTRGIMRLNKDSMIIFSYNGVFINDLKNDTLVEISEDNNFLGVTEDEEGMLWIGKHYHQITSMNKKGEIINTALVLEEKQQSLQLRQPFFDSLHTQIWWGTNNGLYFMKLPYKKLEVFKDKQQQLPFDNQIISQVLIDDEGVWVMGDKGCYLIDEQKRVTHLDWSERLKAVRYMHRDTDGFRWLALINNGLVRWNPATNELKSISRNEGLSHNNIYAIYEDEYDYLWLPSDYGLMRMNKKDFSIQTYFEEDGIAHNEFNNMSHYRDKDGRLYFGGLSGVTTFHPSDFVQETPDWGTLNVTGLQFVKKNKGIIKDRMADFYRDPSITMQTDDQSFILQFVLIDFNKEGRTSYTYKIAGLDNSWTNIDENFIRINRLPYGQYTLLVKGRHLGGQWSDEALEIPLIVNKPVYLTSWFLGLAGAALLLLVWQTVRWRIQWLERDKMRLQEEVDRRTEQVRKQATELEALNRTKDRFFAIIAHDLRNPALAFRGLTKKIKYLIEKGQPERISPLGDAIDEAASNLNRLLNNLLNWSRLQNGRMPFHPKSINLKEAVEESINLFSNIAEVKSIRLYQEIPDHLEAYADTDALALLLRNLLSNAIKFTPSGGQVNISAKRNNGAVEIDVKDSGIGMSPKQIAQLFQLNGKTTLGTEGEKGTGLGLVLCKELVITNKGTLNVVSQVNKGTEFQLLLPARTN